MYELKKIGKVFTSKFVETGPSSYKKRIYRAAVSQRLRNTGVGHVAMKRKKSYQSSPYSKKFVILIDV
jgi:hypothetical protein